MDEHDGGRDKALVGFFGQVKKNVIDSGKDFVKLVEGPCRRLGHLNMCVRLRADDRLGIPVVPGSIIWHAMRVGSVQAYVDSNPIGPRTDAGELLVASRLTKLTGSYGNHTDPSDAGTRNSSTYGS